jgi:hypothetical protein
MKRKFHTSRQEVAFMKPALFLLMITLVFVAACSNDNSVTENNNKTQFGMLKLSLTDQPVGLKEVWVSITNIEVHKTSEAWISFDASGDSVDLLTLQNREQVLQSAPLDPGSYTGIRLDVTEGHIIDASGERCDLKIPSGKVEIPLNFTIDSGKETDVVLDFQADKSVHVVETGHNGQCIMRPVILVKSVSGSQG